MIPNLNNTLLSYLSNSTGAASDGSSGGVGNALVARATAQLSSQQALQRAAGTAKNAGLVQSLETNQKALAGELRAAMDKAGIKLGGPIEFAVKADGSVAVNGSKADEAATRAFLKDDKSQPGFAARIATQARDAMKLSTEIQQSAAISQAAKMAKSSGGVISLYTTLMQQSAATSVVFSLSAGGSSLTYPGSLAAHA